MNYKLRKTGLGLVAAGKRKLLPGITYERLVPQSSSLEKIINPDGTVYNTIEYCAEIVKKTHKQANLIAQTIAMANPPAKDLNAFCKAIFNFFYKHYQYKLDQPGVEQLRNFSRAWKDRKSGIDCDCFTISVSSILTVCGVEHYLKMVKIYGRDYYQHIYVVVPKYKGADITRRNNYYVIDPVLDNYDEEAPQINEDYTKYMSGMPIQYLSGTDGERLGTEFNGLGDGLSGNDAEALYGDFLKRTKRHLINTRNTIARNPRKVNRFYRPKQLVGAYDRLIANWDNEAQREATLEALSGIEEAMLNDSLQGLGDLLHGTDDELFTFLNVDFPHNGMEGLSGKKAQARKATKAAKKAGKQQKKAEKKATKKGVFTKVKNAVKKAKTVVKKAGAKAKDGLKKIGKAIVKNNPVSLAARGGFLIAMKTNFGRLASRAYWGYFSEADAKRAGVTSSYWNKAKQAVAKLEQVFVQKLKGKPDALKKAIITGRAAKKVKKLATKGKLSGLDCLENSGMNGTGQLGVVSAATITAALSFLTPLAQMFGNLFKKKNGKEETETGGETEPSPTDENSLMNDTDPGFTVANDNSEQVYIKEVQNAPVNEDETYEDYSPQPTQSIILNETMPQPTTTPTTRSATTTTNTVEETTDESAEETTQETGDGSNNETNVDSNKGKGKGGLIVAALAVLGVGAMVMGGKKKEKPKTENLGSVSKSKAKKVNLK